MKNLILAIALTFTTGAVSAQMQVGATSPTLPPTTQEEYNYATLGLGTQRAQGLDIKTGYVLSNKMVQEYPPFTILSEELIRTKDNTFACVIVRVEGSRYLSKPLYMCVPNATADPTVFSQYLKRLGGISTPGLSTALFHAMAMRTSNIASGFKPTSSK